MSSPDHIPSGFTPTQWGALLAWLDEYKAASKLREDIQSQRTTATDLQNREGQNNFLNDVLNERPHDRRLLDGQLRVLSAAALEETVLVCAVILESDEPGQWWLLPASEYSRPAVPGEYWIEGAAPAFSVVCIDAARQVPEQLLLNTRTLGCLDAATSAKLARLLDLQRHPLIEPEGDDEVLFALCGPPYFGFSNDPRNAYLIQRHERLGSIDRRVMGILDEMEKWRGGFEALLALPLAADSGERMCHLLVLMSDGSIIPPSMASHAVFLHDMPCSHPEFAGRILCEWELVGVDPALQARMAGCVFSWMRREQSETLGTGVVSGDGCYAKLLNGQASPIMACRENWEATVIVVKLP